MKKQLMALEPNGDWRLVISIHGAEDVVATKGGNLKSRSEKGVYDAAAFKKLFEDDPAFVKWRDKNGPSWTTMNACQVNKPFETAILTALNKPKSSQSAQGLGQGCRPHTEMYSWTDHKGNSVETRTAHRSLSAGEKKEMMEWLKDMNKNFGYFGSPPVAEALLLDYYFNEEPKGAWPTVTISVNYKNQKTWSFYRRTSHPDFLSTCELHRGRMRGHTASVPSVPE
jgi:hypothetical protein